MAKKNFEFHATVQKCHFGNFSIYIYIVLIIFSEKNTIFLRESCQIVQPLAPDQIPVEAKENNYGLSNPGSIQAYLQVVDLMADKLRYASIFLININLLFLLFSKTYLNCLCSSFTNNLRFIVCTIHWIVEILNTND